MTAIEAYILARTYTRQAIEGAGALKGAPCQIQSIEAITGGNRITFAWETGEGETETDTLDVMDGADGDDGVGIASITYKETDAQGNNIYTVTLTSGSTYDITCPKGAQGETGATGATGNGIVSIAKTSTEGLVDTYTITYTNGSTSTFTVTNGATPTVDNEMSESSENPLQNKVITAWTSASAKSVTGNPITISDAAAVKAKALSVSIEPVQDLHGYDKPWVGGAGKNKCNPAIIEDGYTLDATNGLPYAYAGRCATTTPIDVSNYDYVTPSYNSTVQSTLMIFSKFANGTLIARESSYMSGRAIDVSDADQLYISWYSGYDVQISNLSDVMLEEGSTATSYAPYTNICPISGHTEASVQRDGKNLVQNTATSTTIGGITYTVNNDGTVITNGTSSSSILLVSSLRLKKGYYILNSGVSDTKFSKYFIRITDSMTQDTRTFQCFDYDLGGRFTITKDMVLYVTIHIQSGTTVNNVVFKPMVCLATETDMTYVPYYGKTYTIALGDTIYGGTVDFNTGKVNSTRRYRKYVGGEDETWNVSELTNVVRCTIGFSVQTSNKTICNCLTYDLAYDGDYEHFYVYNNVLYVFLLKSRGITDVASLKTWLANNNIEICGFYNTPQELDVTPAQLELLKGTNTLTGNGASISLTYQQDNLAGEILEQVQPQIDDLQGQIDDIPRLVDYSETEQNTGIKWIDGKDIYVKVITKDSDIGTSNLITHNISNMGEVIKAFGMMYLPSVPSFIPLSYVALDGNNPVGGYCVGLSDITSTTISVNLGSSMRDLVSRIRVILYYTKSTT